MSRPNGSSGGFALPDSFPLARPGPTCLTVEQMNIRYIAKLAGVSPSAVSLALRDSPRISAKTKALVTKLARETGYAPDARIVHLMRHRRKPRDVRQQACFNR